MLLIFMFVCLFVFGILNHILNVKAISLVPKFVGSDCDVDIDDCASAPCKNGATCVD